MNELAFELPFALPSLNVRDKQHWAKRARAKQILGNEIMAAIGGPRHFPAAPWRHVRITVTRCSAGRLDQDNLYASFKPVGDSLKALRIIEDDRSDWLTLEMIQATAARGKGSTAVRIARVSDRSEFVEQA